MEERSRKEILEESIKLLQGMKNALSREEVYFEDCTIPGNKYVDCPMARVENRNKIIYRCIGCPLDEKQAYNVYDNWMSCCGCFHHCRIFKGRAGSLKKVSGEEFKGDIKMIQYNISKLKKELKALSNG